MDTAEFVFRTFFIIAVFVFGLMSIGIFLIIIKLILSVFGEFSIMGVNFS